MEDGVAEEVSRQRRKHIFGDNARKPCGEQAKLKYVGAEFHLTTEVTKVCTKEAKKRSELSINYSFDSIFK